MKIDGSVFIVTGGASGLGAATTRMLVAGGGRVVIADVNRVGGEALAAEFGAPVRFAPTDVTQEADGQAAVAMARDTFGAVHGLANCAGIVHGEKMIGRDGPHGLAAFTRVIMINLIGTFNMTRLAAAAMAANPPDEGGERGVVVCTASVAAYDGQVGQAAYAASKAGIAGMTLPIARDLARNGIRIVTIAPGLFRTPMMAGLPAEVQQSLGASVPFPSRLGEPSEYADTVRFIVQTPMMNGEVIRLDGALPDAGRVREALAGCPFVVVSDVIADTDTSAFAHVRLPAAAWGEKDGTVTNSERRVTRQRPVLALPGDARPDWWIVSQVAARMGWASHFAYNHAADIWREHARLTAYQNTHGARVLNLREHTAIGNQAYETMAPFCWGGIPFADGRYPTPGGQARLVTVRQAKASEPLRNWPMTLNTGRYRDQWHTMTRTGLSPKLSRHREEPMVEVHPDDAAALGLAAGGLARVATPQGESVFRIAISDDSRNTAANTPANATISASAGWCTHRCTYTAADDAYHAATTSPPPRPPATPRSG